MNAQKWSQCLEKIERTRRLQPDKENHLLQHANPHLQALIIAALLTRCRLGELLSLQWSQLRC